MARIGVFEHGWWKAACAARSFDVVSLPVADSPDGNVYNAELSARIACGQQIKQILSEESVDWLLDNSATGLTLTNQEENPCLLMPTHEAAGKLLVSHFIDPVNTAFQGLDWVVIWQCLKSTSWVKAVWDKAQVSELTRMGVPHVVHLPMAAPNRRYNIEPLDPQRQRPTVSFVGGQNTSLFHGGTNLPASTVLAGTLSHAVRNGLPGLNFYDIFYDIYGLGQPIEATDPLNIQIEKAATYFNSKLFYSGELCIRNRDRFIIFLKRHLGDKFQLIGSGWDTAYGLTVEPRLATTDEYFDHFRQSAINLNFVNGNAETGLNMRHFEITAAGGFLLCYEQPELGDLFEIGKECVTFRNETDLVEKIDYYLANPDERVKIAQAGQQRTLSEHLYSHRLQQLVEYVSKVPPPVRYADTNPWEDLRSVIPKPDVVLDCGANIGQTADTFRAIFPQAEIYSFEPVAKLFDQLKNRCEPLNVNAVNMAVSDCDGQGVINLTASDEANSLLGFQENNPCAKWTQEVGSESVELCTLDRWCEDNRIDPKRVDVIKLDVQGAELKALHGAKRLLESAKAVYLEVSFVPMYKDCPLFTQIDEFLKQHGYHCKALYPSDQPNNWGDALYVKS